ncbi:hypothetical protein DF157_01015 [Burkholderia cenocepacia]|nr:hypothetical protein DF157_01015 [Burkholderia cenocepacia]RQU35301.1 hypothetical protein DF142_27250 [Burkholderia cenocepacia]RQU61132.1 hypothetical protein DF140_27480 [Burkholderia cenocepacia]
MLSLQHAKTTVPAPRPIAIHASYYVRARSFRAAAKPKEFERFPVLDISIPDSTSLNPKLTNLSSARRISLAIHNSPSHTSTLPDASVVLSIGKRTYSSHFYNYQSTSFDTQGIAHLVKTSGLTPA